MQLSLKPLRFQQDASVTQAVLERRKAIARYGWLSVLLCTQGKAVNAVALSCPDDCQAKVPKTVAGNISQDMPCLPGWQGNRFCSRKLIAHA